MKKNTFAILALLCCALLLAGCGPTTLDQNEKGEKEFEITILSDGYTIDEHFMDNSKMEKPSGIAFTGKNIIVTDIEKNCLHIFDLDGNYLSSFGSIGKGDSQFFAPTGITWFNNLLYVLDSRNNRVQVFDEDFMFVRQYALTTIDSENSYRDIAISSSGDIFVSTQYGLPQYAHIYHIEPISGKQSLIGNSIVGTICSTQTGTIYFAESHELAREKGNFVMRSGRNSLFIVKDGRLEKVNSLPYKYTARKIIVDGSDIYSLSFRYSSIDRFTSDGEYVNTVFRFPTDYSNRGFYCFAYDTERDLFLVSFPEDGKVVCVRNANNMK